MHLAFLISNTMKRPKNTCPRDEEPIGSIEFDEDITEADCEKVQILEYFERYPQASYVKLLKLTMVFRRWQNISFS